MLLRLRLSARGDLRSPEQFGGFLFRHRILLRVGTFRFLSTYDDPAEEISVQTRGLRIIADTCFERGAPPDTNMALIRF